MWRRRAWHGWLTWRRWRRWRGFGTCWHRRTWRVGVNIRVPVPSGPLCVGHSLYRFEVTSSGSNFHVESHTSKEIATQLTTVCWVVDAAGNKLRKAGEAVVFAYLRFNFFAHVQSESSARKVVKGRWRWRRERVDESASVLADADLFLVDVTHNRSVGTFEATLLNRWRDRSICPYDNA